MPKTESGRVLLASPGSSRPRSQPRPIAVARLDQHLERLQQLRRPQQLHQRRRGCRRSRPSTRGQDLLRYQPAARSASGARRTTTYAPLSFERPEPCNLVPEDTAGHRPDRRPPGVPPGPGGVAAARLAGARGLRLRPLRRAQLHDGDARPRRLPRADPQRAPGVLVARRCTERVKDWVFERGGRLMYLGGNGLNCEVEFLDADARCAASRTSLQPAASSACRIRTTRRASSRAASTAPSRVGGEPARRRLRPRPGIMTAAPVSRSERGSLGLRRHGPAATATFRRSRACTSASRRRLRPRDRQDEPVSPPNTSCWRRA